MTVVLQFITKDQCGLCDQALARLRPVARWAGVALDIRDIAEMPDSDMAQRVPVLMAGGTELHSGPLTWPGAVRTVLRTRLGRS